MSGIVFAMSAEAVTAFQRFVDALNQPHDPALLTAAVTDDIHLDRHHPGDRSTPIAETFTGIADVARWLARTPPAIRFSLAGGASPDASGAWSIEYALSTGDFHNGGLWLATLAPDGRIAVLSHHPFALRDDR